MYTSIGCVGGKSPMEKGSAEFPRSHSSLTFRAFSRRFLIKEINAMRSGISLQIHHILLPNFLGS